MTSTKDIIPRDPSTGEISYPEPDGAPASTMLERAAAAAGRASGLSVRLIGVVKSSDNPELRALAVETQTALLDLASAIAGQPIEQTGRQVPPTVPVSFTSEDFVKNLRSVLRNSWTKWGSYSLEFENETVAAILAVPPSVALRLATRPVAWRVLTTDGPVHFTDEAAANLLADARGATLQGLYVRDGSPLVSETDVIHGVTATCVGPGKP